MGAMVNFGLHAGKLNRSERERGTANVQVCFVAHKLHLLSSPKVGLPKSVSFLVERFPRFSPGVKRQTAATRVWQPDSDNQPHVWLISVNPFATCKWVAQFLQSAAGMEGSEQEEFGGS